MATENWIYTEKLTETVNIFSIFNHTVGYINIS